MPLTKKTSFSFNHTGQNPDLSSVYPYDQIQQKWDSRAQEVADSLNALIDILLGMTPGDSGADNVKINEAIIGSGTTVRERVEWLYNQIQGISLGAVPDGSLTEAKLADALAALQTHYGIDAGVANAYAVTINPAPTAYTEPMSIAIKISADSTGPSTINVNGLGPKAIKGSDGLDIGAGDLKAGSIYTLRYNGVNFIVQGKGGVTLAGTAIDSHVLLNDTYYNTDAKTKRTGTMVNNGAVVITPSNVDQTIAEGYHNGLGKVTATTGKRIATGVVSFDASGNATISGLTFVPGKVIIYSTAGSTGGNGSLLVATKQADMKYLSTTTDNTMLGGNNGTAYFYHGVQTTFNASSVSIALSSYFQNYANSKYVIIEE